MDPRKDPKVGSRNPDLGQLYLQYHEPSLFSGHSHLRQHPLPSHRAVTVCNTGSTVGTNSWTSSLLNITCLGDCLIKIKNNFFLPFSAPPLCGWCPVWASIEGQNRLWSCCYTLELTHHPGMHGETVWTTGEWELACTLREQAWKETLFIERLSYSGIIKKKKSKGNISCANEFLDYMFYSY